MTNEYTAALEERFSQLIERHRLLIRKLCWHHARGDVNLCAEWVQDCYIVLWRHLPELSERLSPRQERSWVAWTCRSVLSHRRRRHRRRWIPFDAVPEVLLADTSQDNRARVEALAEGLSQREQHYLRLLLDGYSAREIADTLGIETDSVYKMRRRIIDKMKQNANT